MKWSRRRAFCSRAGTLQGPRADSHREYLDQETAWALGFNAQGLSEEEENLLPPRADEAAYVQVLGAVSVLTGMHQISL